MNGCECLFVCLVRCLWPPMLTLGYRRLLSGHFKIRRIGWRLWSICWRSSLADWGFGAVLAISHPGSRIRESLRVLLFDPTRYPYLIPVVTRFWHCSIIVCSGLASGSLRPPGLCGGTTRPEGILCLFQVRKYPRNLQSKTRKKRSRRAGWVLSTRWHELEKPI